MEDPSGQTAAEKAAHEAAVAKAAAADAAATKAAQDALAAKAAADAARADITDKAVPYARFKEINDKLKTLEAEAQKIKDAEKKALEAKAVDEGKAKELLATKDAELAALKTKTDAFEAEKKGLRESYINKLKDEVDKDVAKDIQAIDKLARFVESRTQSAGPYGGRGGKGTEGLDIAHFKGSERELEAILKARGLAK